MRDADDRHALVAQRVQTLKELAPQVVGHDVALAVANLLDVVHAVLTADLGQDERLQPVQRVDEGRLELVLVVGQCADRTHQDPD